MICLKVLRLEIIYKNKKFKVKIEIIKESIIFFFTEDSEDIDEKSDDIDVDHHGAHDVVIEG